MELLIGWLWKDTHHEPERSILRKKKRTACYWRCSVYFMHDFVRYAYNSVLDLSPLLIFYPVSVGWSPSSCIDCLMGDFDMFTYQLPARSLCCQYFKLRPYRDLLPVWWVTPWSIGPTKVKLWDSLVEVKGKEVNSYRFLDIPWCNFYGKLF